MKIYFSAATSIGRNYLKQCQQTVRICKNFGHQVLSEHIVNPKLQVKKDWMQDWDAKKLYQQERDKVKRCDLMITEVSSPSWGVGLLTEYALSLNKPVLALFYKDNKAKLSLMIQGHPELYTYSYNEDNIKSILNKFFKFVEEKKIKAKGRLIVIDGSDGSGKATQAKLLIDYLKKQKIKNRYIDFPRYYTSFHGKMVGRFLKGDFGSLAQVDPYLVSYTYALDRLAAKDELLDWLAEGNTVVANRYTTSSMAFQSARVPKAKRQSFISWLYELEYKQNRLPKEDIVLYLYVPVDISQKLLAKKAKDSSRRYMGKKDKDINEANIKYQKEVVAMYLTLAKKYKHWEIIDCTDKKGNILAAEKIHGKILTALKNNKLL